MKRLYVFKREGCSNCPAAEAVVREVLDGETCRIFAEFIDADEISNDLQFRLLENSLFIFAVPTLILEEDGRMTLISSGEVPDKKKLLKCVGG